MPTDVNDLADLVTQLTQWTTTASITAALSVLLTSSAISYVVSWFFQRKLQSDLENLKKEHDIEKAKVQAIIDNSSHMRRVQQELEFTALKDMWAHIDTLYSHTSTLLGISIVPLVAGVFQPEMALIDYVPESVKDFAELHPVDDLRLIRGKMEPFLPETIVQQVMAFELLTRGIRSSVLSKQFTTKEDLSTFWISSHEELREANKALNAAFRERLNELGTFRQ